MQEPDWTAWAAEVGKHGGDWDPTISTFPKLCAYIGRFLFFRFSFSHSTPVLHFKLAVSTNRSFMANIRVNCRSPDFKSPTGPTKNLERLYNRVVGCSVGWLVATLVITASSHSKLCHIDQTRPNDQDDQDD